MEYGATFFNVFVRLHVKFAAVFTISVFVQHILFTSNFWVGKLGFMMSGCLTNRLSGIAAPLLRRPEPAKERVEPTTLCVTAI